MDTNVKDGNECHDGIMNLIQIGFDCLSDLDTNVKDGKCHDGLSI